MPQLTLSSPLPFAIVALPPHLPTSPPIYLQRPLRNPPFRQPPRRHRLQAAADRLLLLPCNNNHNNSATSRLLISPLVHGIVQLHRGLRADHAPPIGLDAAA
jgi:hypothetical protein